MSLPHYNFYLASTSPIKKEALRTALGRVGVRDFSIVCIPVPSLVPAQPIGEQTRVGLFNRLENLRYQISLSQPLLAQKNSYLVAMENGIWPRCNGDRVERVLATHYYDKALVAVSNYWGDTTVGTSRGLLIPPRLVTKAALTIFATTAGQFLAQENPAARPDDPHLALTGTPRCVYLAETLVPLLTWSLPELRP